MFRFLLSLLLGASSIHLHAQSTISGTLIDETGTSLPYANLLLYRSPDSTFVTGATTEDDGTFQFTPQPAGTYFITATALGYDAYSGPPNVLSDEPLLLYIELRTSALALETVTVTAQQPMIVRQIDRTVLNVENQPTTAGLTALEVLERSPGVFINRQSGGISMAGKDGVNILVNGRANYLDASGLGDFLASMSADNIKKIELITTPPANFDAAGNAGFINIVLKELPDEGLNGNYTTTLGYGLDNLTGRLGGSLNYRKNRLALFASYDLSQPTVDQTTTLSRVDGGGLLTDLFTDRQPIRWAHNARVGLDYELSSATTIGTLVSGFDNRWTMNALSTTTIRPPNVPDTLVQSDNNELNHWRHLRLNANLRHQFAAGGRISLDADRLYYDNDNTTRYDQVFSSEGFAEESLLTSDKASPFGISVLEASYTAPGGGKFGYSFGAKGIFSTFENTVDILLGGVRDRGLSSFSELDESVYAAFVNTDYALSERTALRAGLRYEYSDTRLDVDGEGRVVDRQFGALFPTFYISHQLTERQQLTGSYGRRLTRPAFTDMAPFVIFLDPRTLTGGDPTLQPALSNVYEIGYRYKGLNVNLNYTTEDSTLVNFQNRFDPTLGFQRIVPDNLREQRTVALSLSFPVQVSEAISARFSPLFTYRKSVNDIDGVAVPLDQWAYQLNGSIDVKLPLDLALQISGFYRGRQLNGNVVFAPTGMLNVGLARQIAGGGRVALNVGDVLNSFYFDGTTNSAQPDFSVTRRFDFSQRTVSLTYSAPFGKRGVRASSRKDNQAEEAGRIQN